MTTTSTPAERPGSGVDQVVDAFQAFGQALAGGESDPWLQSDLTMAQVRTLFAIVRHGPLPVGGVAHQLSVGLPTASHLVECLVRAGLAERKTDAEDRRVVHCSATATGAALIDQAAGARLERMRRLVSRLDPAMREGLVCGLDALTALTQQEDEKEAPTRAGA